MAYRDDAGDVLEAPTAEGPLRVEVGPRSIRLTVAARTLHITGPVATLLEHAKPRWTHRLDGRLATARDVPHEDLGVWLEVDPGPRAGMQRVFGVAPVSLLEPDGLAALGALDRLHLRLRVALAELRGAAVLRAVEIGRGLDKVLLADHGDRLEVFARRLFRDRAHVAAEIRRDGRIVVFDGKHRRELTVRSRFGVTVTGDYVRFAAPDGADLARISIPWIAPEDRREVARRIGQLVDPG